MTLQFYSTKDPAKKATVSLAEAVLQGLAPDGGLFMPETLPTLDPAFFNAIFSLSLPEIALEVARHLLAGSIDISHLQKMVEVAFTFDAPLVPLADDLYVLELFHGPTLSFKDFGARFMAQLMAYFNRHSDRELHILAATSGDTGSAVAHGFLNVPGIKVCILYPRGQVSLIQEKQLTTMGANVTALEIAGSFDDCQALVKQAFNDRELLQQRRLTSANSINIARLLPQSFYYFYAYAQLKKAVGGEVVVSVPSGNFGNLTAGLFAQKMGLPITRFVAATNINDSVPRYLKTGRFEPHPSKSTISNAMDVGHPSNFARILDLFNSDVEGLRQLLYGESFTDDQTKAGIRELQAKYSYVADPHGAIAYLGLCSYLLRQQGHAKGIFLETAHPAKFLDVVEPIVQEKVAIPERLQAALAAPKRAQSLSHCYPDFKAFLLA